jgi:hypothetical protein
MTIVAAALGAVISSTTISNAQSYPKAKLVPGSADVIHDVLGIEIGMTCPEAIAKGKQISAFPGQNLNMANEGHADVRLDGQLYHYGVYGYEVPIKVVDGSDVAYFRCLEDGTPGEVYEVTRQINYQQKPETAPPIAALRQIFQEKYGVPTVEFNPFTFAILFNKKGPITNPNQDASCVTFQNGSLYDGVFGAFNAGKCSYALTFVGYESRKYPGKVDYIKIVIHDYLRLENDIRAMEKRRLENAHVALPKL